MHIYFFFDLLTNDVFFFFFSSRRRHTRCLSDWSSDVCSSDLERVARVFALRKRAERQLRRKREGNILGAMHGQVRAALENRVLQFFDEESLPGRFRERAVEDAISIRLHRHEFARMTAGAKQGLHALCLPQRERAATGGNTKNHPRLARGRTLKSESGCVPTSSRPNRAAAASASRPRPASARRRIVGAWSNLSTMALAIACTRFLWHSSRPRSTTRVLSTSLRATASARARSRSTTAVRSCAHVRGGKLSETPRERSVMTAHS